MRPRRGSPFAPTLVQDLLARMLYGGASRSPGSPPCCRHHGRHHQRAIAACAKRSDRSDVVTDLFLSFPRCRTRLVIYLFRDSLKAVFAGLWRLHHSSTSSIALDAFARLCARRSGSVAKKDSRGAAPRARYFSGGAHILAQRSGAGDLAATIASRPRSSRNRRCRFSASAFRPTYRRGAASFMTPRTISTLHPTGRCFPALRSSSPCCRSTSSATACATRSIRAR